MKSISSLLLVSGLILACSLHCELVEAEKASNSGLSAADPINGDPTLPVFTMGIQYGQWSVAPVQAVFQGFLSLPNTILLISLQNNQSAPTIVQFQFTSTNKVACSESLQQQLSAGNAPGIIAAFRAVNLQVSSLNYTAAANPNATPRAASSEAENWAAANPEIIAGIAAGVLIIVIAIVIVVLHRRAKRHELMRETMEAMLGDQGTPEAGARPRAPSQQATGKKRAPAASVGNKGAGAAPAAGPQRDAKAPGSGSINPHRARLVSFYQKYNPEKLDSVDATLVRYAGREGELFESLTGKYGPEPEAAGAPAAAAPQPAAETERSAASPSDTSASINATEGTTKEEEAPAAEKTETTEAESDAANSGQ